jgi:hypothetical protein
MTNITLSLTKEEADFVLASLWAAENDGFVLTEEAGLFDTVEGKVRAAIVEGGSRAQG